MYRIENCLYKKKAINLIAYVLDVNVMLNFKNPSKCNDSLKKEKIL